MTPAPTPGGADVARPTPNAAQDRLFVLNDGRNVILTFVLVSSLFLLWGFCNGMIDVMDKHFQEELHLTLAQSAWVQFAHYLGYFLMSLPAGWLAIRLGYRGGIIAGLLLVAVGGLWFIPATHIAQFWAFLVGVCVIASGLTFLETIANPYTTVLGSPRYAATRINLAQSCNGIGWFFGPIAGALFFYSKDAAGVKTGSQTLWIPYAGVAAVVMVLIGLFAFAPVPDLKTEDDYHLDDADPSAPAPAARQVRPGLNYLLLFLNAAVLVGVFDMILWVILSTAGTGTAVMEKTLGLTGGAALVAAAVLIRPVAQRLSHHSIWSHPHFTSATLAQFFYVAAQAGIFSFLINYMTSEVPAIPASWAGGWLQSWFDVQNGIAHFSDRGASNLASLGFLCFLTGRFSGAAILKKFSAHRVLGLYATINVLVCGLVVLKLGWPSVVGVFLSYFFMSIMFPTIFALGIFGLGLRAKRASGFIVMAIMGGAMLPKLMGHVADLYGMSRGFLVPLACFALVALYGWCWPALSQAESLHGLKTTGGH